VLQRKSSGIKGGSTQLLKRKTEHYQKHLIEAGKGVMAEYISRYDIQERKSRGKRHVTLALSQFLLRGKAPNPCLNKGGGAAYPRQRIEKKGGLKGDILAEERTRCAFRNRERYSENRGFERRKKAQNLQRGGKDEAGEHREDRAHKNSGLGSREIVLCRRFRSKNAPSFQ